MCVKSAAHLALVPLLLSVAFSAGLGSDRYTKKQLEALAARLGKTYWVAAVEGRVPPFASAPTASARSFRPEAHESFELVELLAEKTPSAYYKAVFASGKIGYIAAEAFLEELNAAFLLYDPLADERKKQSEGAEEEKKRVAWIRSRPWSEAVKEAAIERRPAIGMTGGEVTGVLGKPLRINKVKGRQHVAEERWIYRDAPTLVFTNGLLTRIEAREVKQD